VAWTVIALVLLARGISRPALRVTGLVLVAKLDRGRTRRSTVCDRIGFRPKGGGGGRGWGRVSGMADRYADAVRARRGELRALRAQLTGGHRAELRSALALSRLAASAEITTAVAELAAAVAAHLERADREARRQFPAHLARAVDDTARRLSARWVADLRPVLLRIATSRSLPVRPTLPAARPLPAPPVPAPLGRLRSVLAGAVQGVALWRLLLVPLVLLPVWGMPALGGRALAPLAAGTGVAAVAVAARARCVTAERVRLRRHADEVLAAAGIALEADLGRRLIELEAATTGLLDAAVRQRRAEVEAELALLAPAVSGAPDGAPDG
jgi:hypothetical protein